MLQQLARPTAAHDGRSARGMCRVSTIKPTPAFAQRGGAQSLGHRLVGRESVT
jgi:hypothetical protein